MLNLQGGQKDQATLINNLMPLERALSAQTYLVQDALSLADIVIALDIKHMVGVNHYVSILIISIVIISTLYCLGFCAHPANFRHICQLYACKDTFELALMAIAHPHL